MTADVKTVHTDGWRHADDAGQTAAARHERQMMCIQHGGDGGAVAVERLGRRLDAYLFDDRGERERGIERQGGTEPDGQAAARHGLEAVARNDDGVFAWRQGGNPVHAARRSAAAPRADQCGTGNGDRGVWETGPQFVSDHSGQAARIRTGLGKDVNGLARDAREERDYEAQPLHDGNASIATQCTKNARAPKPGLDLSPSDFEDAIYRTGS